MPVTRSICHSHFPADGQNCSLPRIKWPAWLFSRLFVLSYLRLIAQNGVQQRRVDLDFSVVADESLFSEFVHEKADPGSSRADHFRQRFLTEFDRGWLCGAFLTEFRQQQQQARQPPLAGIEELVDQIVFDPAVSGQ